MQARSLKIIAALLIISAVFMGILGYKISQKEIAPAPQSAPTGSAQASEFTYAQKVLVVNKAIEKGVAITSEDIELVPFPIKVEDGLQKPSDVINRKLQVNIAKGEVIRQAHFENPSQLADLIRPGYRAVAIKVDEVISAGGFLKPGDHVDVIFSMRANKESYDKSLTRRVLRNTKLLALGDSVEKERLEPESENSKKSSKTGKNSRSAVLEVPEDNINMLILAEERGDLRLVAVGEKDLALAQKNSELDAGMYLDVDDKATFIRAVTGLKPPAPPKSVYVYNGDSVETIRVPK